MSRLLAWWSAPPSGQHAENTPATPDTEVSHGPWDAENRAAAAELDRAEPSWLIWYGPWSRRFYAIAAWGAQHPVLLDAHTADDLLDQMRDTEVTAMLALHGWTGAA